MLGQAPQATRRTAAGLSAGRSRSAPGPATSPSTCSVPVWCDEATCTDISTGMVAMLAEQCDAARSERENDARRRRVAAVRGTRASTSCSGHAVLHHLPDLRARVYRISPCAAARRQDRVRRGAVADRRPPGLDSQAQRRGRGARCGAVLRLRGATVASSDDQIGRRCWRARRHPRVHAGRRSPPTHARQASRRFRCAVRSYVANWFGWFNRALEATADPDDVPDALAPLRVRRVSRCCSGWTATCWSRACRRRSSTTCC